MNMPARNLPLPGSVLLVLVLCGCSPLNWIGRTELHPMPRTDLGDDTAVTYVRQQRDWFQFRIELKEHAPRHDEEYDYYHVAFKAAVSVWRFNRKTGEYDIRSQIRGPRAERSIVFSFARSDEVKLRMADSAGGATGGSAGWPDNNMTDARISLDPEPTSLGVPVADGMVFRVRATAIMQPTARDRNKGASPVEISAEQKWKVDIQYPRKRVKFIRVQ
jgi:hypothetical protein